MEFLESAPNNFPYASIVEDAFSFACHINHINNAHKCLDIDTDIYKEIITFNDFLFKYLKFLKRNAVDAVNFPLSFKLKSDDAIILEKAEKNLKRLKSRCRKIQKKLI